jgi:hypothetical protein
MKAPVALLALVASYVQAGESADQAADSQAPGSASYLCQGVATVTFAGRETSTYYITQPITVSPEQTGDLAEAWGVHLETLHQYFVAPSPPSPLIRERESAVPLQRRVDDRRAQVVVARNCVELKTDPTGWEAFRHSLIYENKPNGIAIVDDAFTYAGPLPPDQGLMYFCASWSSDRKTLYLSSLFVANPPTLQMSPVVSAWRDYAANTLGLKSGWASSCNGGIGREGMKKHDGLKELLASTAGTTLHEVNWTFGRR